MVGVLLLVAPFSAMAQTTVAPAVATNASTQQSFVAELQALEQELVALTTTIQGMIAASGGSTTSSPSPSSGTIPTSYLKLPQLSSGTVLDTSSFTGMSDDELNAMLLNTLTSSVPISMPSSAASTTSAASQETTGTVSSTITSQPIQSNQPTIATQLDPSCNSGLWSNDTSCNGLFYCTANGGYWSATLCTAH